MYDVDFKRTNPSLGVFDVLALGKSHREIGELLKISPRTVEVHKGRVLEKLGIKTLADILRIAIKT